MKNKNSNLFPLITGILVGGATVYFLKSERGQQIIDLALKKSESVKNTIVENSKEVIESSQNAINKAIESGKDSLSGFKEEARDVANNKLDELDKGIQKAKNKVSKSDSK